MRKKGKKAIIPEGAELMDYLNRGFAICNKCGAVMDRREDPRGGCDTSARPVDGKLMKWSTSMKAEIRWSSYKTKEATTT